MAEVRAAGGIVWRRVADDHPTTEVLVVHRPKYDDWTFPKGKLDAGETFEGAALREVEEEAGLVCELGRELPSTTYRDHKGRGKIVRYWAMTPVAGSFAPNDEVDEVRWLTPEAAAPLLSYDRDRTVLVAFVG